ncbi:oplophorus-luciferin 2-monooxygenase non-catalytic subunit-like [Penaeus japonicus]|uniref:oplophorus-luciferin 2-monooxygenase non-catalytic subunit-like n=1 Tax=Penaeus japonicus TaxID=27405 RepID=UPI001C715225|nr:oplophorus-luciferin 2-monooxygenase non-catalytic subunit-like [Penaeus japonicus]
MDMLCSFVVDFELARVFEADFPFKHFRRLELRNSIGLTVLQEGEFGAVSFEEVLADLTGLVEVQERALSQSYSTLTTLKLDTSQITRFPFAEIPSFTSLRELYLYGNQLDRFPDLSSETLVVVSLSFNRISEIPVDGLKNVPNIEDFHFQGNNLQYVFPR